MFLALWFLVGNFFALAQKQVSKSVGPPAFFLQDSADGLCLAGSKFKRCAVDTLWFVEGKPGNYQIHHRVVDELDDESCLDRVQCHLDESEVQLSNCNHCGAKKWNILGDASTGRFNSSSLGQYLTMHAGYVLTEDNNKNCLLRRQGAVGMVLCSKGFSTLNLKSLCLYIFSVK